MPTPRWRPPEVGVRLGVDVGGTFTKAVAVAADGSIVARSVVPTSHAAASGIAEGVVATLHAVSLDVEAAGLGPVLMVGHSTSLAVNALLEGDLPRVGLIGIGRAPDLGIARRRTQVAALELAPGRVLTPLCRFIDATGGLKADVVERTLDELLEAGVEAVAVNESFSVDDSAGEELVLRATERRGLPACAGHQLSGLLGLEMRTVSALVNAAILPRARATAQVVADGLAAAGISAPLLILRGDGGATDLRGFAEFPLRSLFSGPAASVSGALHHLKFGDGVMLEIGGTSTNVALIRGGRPSLAYVRVGRSATCLRSLDVWVAGVAGGSMARIKGRDIHAVGPRSAHIAGLPYASFVGRDELDGSRAALIAPRPGDAADHLILERGRHRFALTVTCAANALGVVAGGAYAAGSHDAAVHAFEIAGRDLGIDGRRLAQRFLDRAVDDLSRTVRSVCAAADADVRRVSIVGVGGGAGTLVHAIAARLGVRAELAANAEVLSSIGAASSLIHTSAERSAVGSDAATIAEVVAEAEAAAIAAGGAPSTIETTTEFDSRTGIVRAATVATLALEAGATTDTSPAPATAAVEPELKAERAAHRLGVRLSDLHVVGQIADFTAFAAGPGRRGTAWALVDRRGAIAHAGIADALLVGGGPTFLADAVARIRAAERSIGPVSIAPSVLVVPGHRIIDYSPLTRTTAVIEAVQRELGDTSGRARGDALIAIERSERN